MSGLEAKTKQASKPVVDLFTNISPQCLHLNYSSKTIFSIYHVLGASLSAQEIKSFVPSDSGRGQMMKVSVAGDILLSISC